MLAWGCRRTRLWWLIMGMNGMSGVEAVRRLNGDCDLRSVRGEGWGGERTYKRRKILKPLIRSFIHSVRKIMTKKFVRTDTCFSNVTSSGFERRETTKVYIQAWLGTKVNNRDSRSNNAKWIGCENGSIERISLQLNEVRGVKKDKTSSGKKNSLHSLSILVQFKGILKIGIILKGIERWPAHSNIWWETTFIHSFFIVGK